MFNAIVVYCCIVSFLLVVMYPKTQVALVRLLDAILTDANNLDPIETLWKDPFNSNELMEGGGPYVTSDEIPDMYESILCTSNIDCLFNAISMYIEGNETLAIILREVAVMYVYDHFESFQAYIDFPESMANSSMAVKREFYASKMRPRGTWASNLVEGEAFATALVTSWNQILRK